MGTLKHFKTGSKFPDLKKDVLRLYSMQFCPYAHRTRLVLAHKGIRYEKINVSLKDKPEWFIQRNPLGLVPVLEINNKVIYESKVCNEYLDDVYPQKKLQISDPYIKARQSILMVMVDSQFTPLFYKLLPHLYKLNHGLENDEVKQIIDDMGKVLTQFEEALQGVYFGGDDLSVLDVHLWPYLGRVGFIRDDTGIDAFPTQTFPKLVEYEKTMWKHPAVKETSGTLEGFKRFAITYFQGDPDFDFGINE